MDDNTEMRGGIKYMSRLRECVHISVCVFRKWAIATHPCVI